MADVFERELVRGEPDRLEAMTAFGAPVFHSYSEITAAMRQHLGILAAASFAKPTQTGQTIVWTTDLEGPIRSWNELSTAEREALDPLRRDLGVRFMDLVETLRRSGINTKLGNQSHLLEAALVVPGVEHLHVVGDRPVLTFWGFRLPGDCGLDPFCAALPVPPPRPVFESQPQILRRRRIWPWLLIGLLILPLSAGVRWWISVPPPVVPAPQPERVVELPKLQEPEAPPAPAPPEPVTPEPQPPQPPPLKPMPLEKPPVPVPIKPGALLRMPQDGDVSSLQGCWRTDRYSYGGSGDNGFSTYCFDARGHGHLTHAGQGHTCEAPADIELRPDGSMYLADQNATCSDGSAWYQDRLLCRGGADGVAHCAGQSNSPGQVMNWNTTLRHR